MKPDYLLLKYGVTLLFSHYYLIWLINFFNLTKKLKEMNENQSFTMHSVFPKRDYTSQDMSFTLRELQLVPSASLLIIPVNFCL